MKTAPLFSIVTICRNADTLIQETIRSILSQSCSNFEFIVIDGASTDNTLPIIQEFRQRIDVLVSEPDQGITDAMNKGLRHCSGELIIYLHAGDTFTAVNTLELIESDYKGRKWLWATGSTNYLSKPGTIISFRPTRNYSKKLLYRYNFICHQSTVVNTSSLRQIGGFSSRYKVAMDYELWLKLSLLSDARILPFTVSNYLLGGLSSKRLKVAYKEFREARFQILKRPLHQLIYQEFMAEFWYLISDSGIAYRARKLLPPSLKSKVRDILRKTLMPQVYSDRT